ncbi:hypothetical protein QJS04_geneDACA024841 [Acorus gramineus]|uniref:Uncharacterized protein n=1 Tax=Acorus gramineus TaxID=55184 RepID=A0AAV8ZXY9_ACOGR|nr:hypothetical protein QJS04_geneDACA024841 [Acorus gramineus]
MMFWKERERESRKDRNGRADRCGFSLSAIQAAKESRYDKEAVIKFFRMPLMSCTIELASCHAFAFSTTV